MKRTPIFLVFFLLAFHGYTAADTKAASLDENSYPTAQTSQNNSNVKKEGLFSWRRAANVPRRKLPPQSFAGDTDSNIETPRQKSSSDVRSVDAAQSAEVKAVDLNRQIQDIIRVNDTAKTNQALKLAELQSVQEQLEIHQRILKTLEVVKPVTPPVSRNDVDEILRQEKIRLIHEQTARNSQIVKTLEQQRRS